MRPNILHAGGILYWTLATRDPDTMVAWDADSLPTVAVRKNGVATADSVTVVKRSATTGIYDCSYNPAGEVEGDIFTFEETATITGSLYAPQADYLNVWSINIVSLESSAPSASQVATAVQTELNDDFATLNSAISNIQVDNAAIADAVLQESILDHKNVAHSLAKYIYQIKQANLAIEGVVSNAITPTTLTFSSNVVATTSAYAHAVLLFISGPLAGENSPIISYNNTNGVFVLEEPLTAAPSNGDEFVVIAGSHVHAIADIQAGLATSTQVNNLANNLPTEAY